MRLSNDQKEKIRSGIEYSRRTAYSAWRKAWPWVLRHKAVALVAILVAYILFRPASPSPPQLRGPENPTVAIARNAVPTTHPTTVPVSQQLAGDIPLFMPGQADSDPQWGLPAELKAQDVQNLARQVDNLEADLHSTVELAGQYEAGMRSLLEPIAVNFLWGRIRGQGFHDKNLPLDWYELVKGKIGPLTGYTDLAEELADAAIQGPLLIRLQDTKYRLIGGRVVIGDILFMKAFQHYTDQHLAFYKQAMPAIKSVNQRMNDELYEKYKQQSH